jgi:hypothetical protein
LIAFIFTHGTGRVEIRFAVSAAGEFRATGPRNTKLQSDKNGGIFVTVCILQIQDLNTNSLVTLKNVSNFFFSLSRGVPGK